MKKLYIRNDYYSMVMTEKQMIEDYCALLTDSPEWLRETSFDAWLKMLEDDAGLVGVEFKTPFESWLADAIWNSALATDDADEISRLEDYAYDIKLNDDDFVKLSSRLHVRREEIANNQHYFERVR